MLRCCSSFALAWRTLIRSAGLIAPGNAGMHCLLYRINLVTRVACRCRRRKRLTTTSQSGAATRQRSADDCLQLRRRVHKAFLYPRGPVFPPTAKGVAYAWEPKRHTRSVRLNSGDRTRQGVYHDDTARKLCENRSCRSSTEYSRGAISTPVSGESRADLSLRLELGRQARRRGGSDRGHFSQ